MLQQEFCYTICLQNELGFFKNKKLRILHLFLIILVSCESILGLTCPLTSLENYLRNILNTETLFHFG